MDGRTRGARRIQCALVRRGERLVLGLENSNNRERLMLGLESSNNREQLVLGLENTAGFKKKGSDWSKLDLTPCPYNMIADIY